jgi:hypothetical protein
MRFASAAPGDSAREVEFDPAYFALARRAPHSLQYLFFGLFALSAFHLGYLAREPFLFLFEPDRSFFARLYIGVLFFGQNGLEP